MFDSSNPVIFQKKKKQVTVPEPWAPLCDTHGHLLCFWNADPKDVLVRAARAGVERLVTLIDPIGDNMSISAYQAWLDRLLSEASEVEIPQVAYLAGVHPYGAATYTDEIHAQIEQALDDPRCVGVGEIGLDYHFDAEECTDPASHEIQIDCFTRQLELACRRNVPVELHLRHEADDEVCTSHADAYNVLRSVGIPQAGCVLHCFGEDVACMQCFVDLGCHIAYGGAATFKRNDEIRAAFAATPLDRILFETDCPYMAPEPIRGLECEPAMIGITAQALICDRVDRTGEDAATIALAAWENAERLFFQGR